MFLISFCFSCRLDKSFLFPLHDVPVHCLRCPSLCLLNPLGTPRQHSHMLPFDAHASPPHSPPLSLHKGSLSLCMCNPKEAQRLQLLCVMQDAQHIQVMMIKIHLPFCLKLEKKKRSVRHFLEIYSRSSPQARY